MTNCLQYHEDLPLSRLIYHTAHAMKIVAEKLLKPYDLTIEQLYPLKILATEPGLNQRQIGEQCSKTPSNLTRILDRLEKKELIERRRDPHDRRTTQIFLTSRGKTLLTEVTGILDGFSERIIEGISMADRQITKSSLDTIVRNIKALEFKNQPS
ncbi:MAG: hypothetical protein C0613_13880 [Desulfobulbaceae bacterium]|nr:MAG: hypothetical protein C0613_13880 [Desulfobulbaceae bacterium]